MARDKGREFRGEEEGDKTEMEALHSDDYYSHVCGEDKWEGLRERFLDDDLQWPLRGTLWPNWIIQLAFSPVLCLLRSVAIGRLSLL